MAFVAGRLLRAALVVALLGILVPPCPSPWAGVVMASDGGIPGSLGGEAPSVVTYPPQQGLATLPPQPLEANSSHHKMTLAIAMNSKQAQTPWEHGIHQVPLHLVDMFRQHGRHHVYLVDLGYEADTPLSPEYGSMLGVHVRSFQQALQLPIDIWLATGFPLSQEQANRVQHTGAKLAAFVRENMKRQYEDAYLFPQAPQMAALPPTGLDGILLADHLAGSQAHLELLTGSAPVRVPLPYGPRFYDTLAGIIKQRRYYTKRSSKNVTVFEPNTHVDRCFAVPVAAAELLYRTTNKSIDHVTITNAERFSQLPEVNNYLTNAISMYPHRVSTHDRFKAPWVLSQFTDAVASHQWGAPVTHTLLDVMHAGFPLVHNSERFKDCGFYYPENDIATAAQLLQRALSLTEQEIRQLHDGFRRCLWRHHIHNPAVLLSWETALYAIGSSPRSPQRTTELELAIGHIMQRRHPPSFSAPAAPASSSSSSSAAAAFSSSSPSSSSSSSSSTATAARVETRHEEATQVGDHVAAHGVLHGLGNLRLNRSMVPPKRKYRIGLTTSVTPQTHSIWAAGIMQTVLFLYDLLTQEGRHEAVLVNLMKGSRENVPEDWKFEERHFLVDFETAMKLPLDVVLEVGMQLNQEQINRIQAKGTRVVTYRGGNDRVMTEERYLFKHGGPSPLFGARGHDAVWTLPSFYNHSAAFLETVFRAPVRAAPFVWNPRFFEHHVSKRPASKRYYQPGRAKKTVSVYESNFHVIKNAIMPLTIAEHLYRRNASAFEQIIVACTSRLVKRKEFVNFVANSLTLHRDHKATFTGRVVLPSHTADHSDVVVSHQWANELNYMYLDLLHAGYPLVHNSEFFKDCGYFYHEHDAWTGADHLQYALKHHDNDIANYSQQAIHCLWRFHTANEKNALGWDALLDEVVNTPRPPERVKQLEEWVAQRERMRGPTTSPVAQRVVQKQKAQEEELRKSNSTAPQHRFRIALTISIPKETTSIFTDGAKQSAFFLWEMFTYLDRHEVVFVNLNTGNVSAVATDWGLPNTLTVVNFEEAITMKCDVWMEVGMQLSERQIARIQLAGGKVISYRTGNDYVMATESMLFDFDRDSMLNTRGHDEIWTFPAFFKTASFLKTIFGERVQELPFVWSPFFFENTAQQLTNRKYYVPRGRQDKTVGVFESNLHAVKNCIVPLVILERLYRNNPELLRDAKITNTATLRKRPEFSRFVESSLRLYQDDKVDFVGRYKLPYYLAEHVDVVLSHQWGNPTNYLYFDTMFAAYPLVHNSPFLKGCGYFYSGDDAVAGEAALRRAMTEYDKDTERVYDAYAECIWRHLTRNVANLRQWEERIQAVLSKQRTAERRAELEVWRRRMSGKAANDAASSSSSPSSASDVQVDTRESTPAPDDDVTGTSDRGVHAQGKREMPPPPRAAEGGDAALPSVAADRAGEEEEPAIAMPPQAEHRRWQDQQQPVSSLLSPQQQQAEIGVHRMRVSAAEWGSQDARSTDEAQPLATHDHAQDEEWVVPPARGLHDAIASRGEEQGRTGQGRAQGNGGYDRDDASSGHASDADSHTGMWKQQQQQHGHEHDHDHRQQHKKEHAQWRLQENQGRHRRGLAESGDVCVSGSDECSRQASPMHPFKDVTEYRRDLRRRTALLADE